MKIASQMRLHHDPGTPDDDVSEARRAGRQYWRKHPGNAIRAEMVAILQRERNRAEWWAGWYDERLRKFYRR